MRIDLGRQREPACCERPQRMLHGCGGVAHVAGLELGPASDQLAVGERLQVFTELGWCIDDQRFERDDRGTAGFHGRITSDFDLSDQFCAAIRALWNGGRDPSQHRPGSSFRGESVTLAVVAPLAPVAVADFHNPDGVAAHEARETDPVGAELTTLV